MVQLFVLVFEVLCVNLNTKTEKSVCSDFSFFHIKILFIMFAVESFNDCNTNYCRLC